ncbi:hypothetical protein CISG_01552 [Coccidioides immitis RMSCC 3703]|uniref:Uncharacterized protein n=1 Tax=Coccidioides immitis RMSCC 3703 TaxID=454286 RepID=A0A0J8QZ85_COCIT|nr:hypothetical protein CISG_01552 [Coccidioides immitis RMSCC 3703]
MVIEPSLLLFPENGSREWKALLHLKRPAVKRRWPIWLASGLSAGAASVRPMGIEEPARCQFLQVLFYCYYGELLAVRILYRRSWPVCAASRGNAGVGSGSRMVRGPWTIPNLKSRSSGRLLRSGMM